MHTVFTVAPTRPLPLLPLHVPLPPRSAPPSLDPHPGADLGRRCNHHSPAPGAVSGEQGQW
eukprot:3174742-Rhodomonas_salina.1